ncbi:MAG: bifunctional UDP-N-acetylglucosamine diphosphorylase/glucosamine-1-phosphate N-acetyltransferase GlmU [Coxiellaceae bacterium]|nr:bifunctional UDP-N-acetylglucosamine diphosphorylase/glucosamine-1-phosphate N-acetyltransferase GlmU [Coxiellaceae bacterium]
MGLNVVILAAGKGKRMISDIPKVLHKLAGVAMLERVVRTAEKLNPNSIQVIHGNGGSKVREALDYLPVEWVKQEEQLGTGHAVMQALPSIDQNDQVLVLYGDVPLISEETLSLLLNNTAKNALGLVVTELQDPTGLGRIIRNELGNIVAIVEHKDANEQQLLIREINTGILTTSAANLKRWLPMLENANAQGEYYLTDIVGLAVQDGVSVGGILARTTQEVQGVNDRWQMAQLEHYFQGEMAKKLTLSGVAVMDINRTYVRGDVDISQDVVLDVNVVMEGTVKLGKHTRIGPNVMLKDTIIGEGVIIGAHSVLDGVILEDDCEVGPFSRLRPGTILRRGAKVGNFVELKKTILGEGSKANHLAYLGDTEIGKDVNIGAGTITCNYDGVNKHRTVIEDDAFIGTNNSLVAPVTIGKGATTGAGSTITADVPEKALAVGRGRQKIIDGWQRPTKKEKETV